MAATTPGGNPIRKPHNKAQKTSATHEDPGTGFVWDIGEISLSKCGGSHIFRRWVQWAFNSNTNLTPSGVIIVGSAPPHTGNLSSFLTNAKDPVINTLTPPSGTILGGQAITVSGAWLSGPPLGGIKKVKMGKFLVSTVTTNSSTSATFTSPRVVATSGGGLGMEISALSGANGKSTTCRIQTPSGLGTKTWWWYPPAVSYDVSCPSGAFVASCTSGTSTSAVVSGANYLLFSSLTWTGPASGGGSTASGASGTVVELYFPEGWIYGGIGDGNYVACSDVEIWGDSQIRFMTPEIASVVNGTNYNSFSASHRYALVVVSNRNGERIFPQLAGSQSATTGVNSQYECMIQITS